MKFYLGVTDNNWFKNLSQINPEDVNFWQPGGKQKFKALLPGSPFLFKLKKPLNAIGGIGFFSSHTFLPLSVAWDTFHERNGTSSFRDFQSMIFNCRNDKSNLNPTIGCIVLTNPIFFKQTDWIPIPKNWANSIVQGKSYSTDEFIGQNLWNLVEKRLNRYLPNTYDTFNNQLLMEPAARYGNPVLTKVRLGQGAFRVLVTDAYTRRCTITGEKTLPVLEAAHIQSYSLEGPNVISNGLLLRSDIHKLFDSGYLTITKDLKVEISKRIKEEFDNGKEYYKFHGNGLLHLPTKEMNRPNPSYIDWHNTNIYNG